jgi:hypothetical protein
LLFDKTTSTSPQNIPALYSIKWPDSLRRAHFLL